MATHSSILAWIIPWTEEPGGLQSIGSQRVGHDWVDLASTHAQVCCIRTQRSLVMYMYTGMTLTNTVKEGMSGILLHHMLCMPSQVDSIRVSLLLCLKHHQSSWWLLSHSHTTAGSCHLTGYLDPWYLQLYTGDPRATGAFQGIYIIKGEFSVFPEIGS